MGGKVNGIRSSSPVHNIIKHNDGNGVKCFVFIEFCYGQILECQDFQTWRLSDFRFRGTDLREESQSNLNLVA